MLSCSEDECQTPSVCADATSDEAQCFFTCEGECGRTFSSDFSPGDANSDDECSAMCETECGRLLKGEEDEEVRWSDLL